MNARFLFSLCALAGGLVLSALTATAQVDRAAVEARYDAGRNFARNGNHAAALNEFLWCFDEGMLQVPSFAGVRLSFLLSDIGRLMPVFPPAREALSERCDAAEKRALGEPNDRRAIGEFAALCSTLGDDKRLVRVFDLLPKDDPRRRAFGLRAFRIFVADRRYADALVVYPFDQMKRSFLDRAKRPPPVSEPRVLEGLMRNTISSGLDYVEVLAGAGDLKSAREMIDVIVDFDASRETQKLLKERLERAGQPDLLKEPEPKK